jgi:hypothetical protein
MKEAIQVVRFEPEPRDVRDICTRVNKILICEEIRDGRCRVGWFLFFQKFKSRLKDLAEHRFLAQDEVLDTTLKDEA